MNTPFQSPIPWSKGTDLRTRGLYQWPHTHFLEPGQEPEIFPSVTNVLDLVGGGMVEAKTYFIADYVAEVLDCAIAKRPVPCWDNDAQQMTERRASDVLADKNWIKAAGGREMTKRANRGTIVHDALEDWALNGVRVDKCDIDEYTATLINAQGFALTTDYVSPYVRSLLAWLQENVEVCTMSEAVVLNRTYNYAGTADFGGMLKFYPGHFLIDVKCSKQDYPSHRLQMAAYVNAEFVGVRGTDQLLTIGRDEYPRFTRCANLYVQPEKCTLREWTQGEEQGEIVMPVAFDAFLHARMLWQDMEAKHHPVTIKSPRVARVKASDIRKPERYREAVAAAEMAAA